MLRIIANENISRSVIQVLRDRGHDVLAVKEVMQSAPDGDILARAQAEERLVITHDKDFGELAFRFGLPSSCGVVLFRLAGTSRDSDNRRVITAIESRSGWAGCFSVVTNDRIRSRPLP